MTSVSSDPIKPGARVIAIACADIHLSMMPPPARAEEPDWFAAMARPLSEIKGLAEQHQCPVLCAGDIFDRWNSPPELINFAMKHLPYMYAIPGQHDLPNHNLKDIQRSAYWTLVAAERIHNIEEGELMGIGTTNTQTGRRKDVFAIKGFPWGVPVTPCESPKYETPHLYIALVHSYTWIRGSGYTGAPEQAKATHNSGKYKGWDIAITGDNHTPFDAVLQKCWLYNCGSLMKRKADEKHSPRVGLICSDGTVVTHLLDCSKDVFNPAYATDTIADQNLDDYLAKLRDMQTATLDYAEELRRRMDQLGVPPAVRRLLVCALDNGTATCPE